jgi:outer membrane PBP1 activator LpoA protein
MGNLSGVVGHLKKELKRAQQEVQRFTAALAALGSSGSNGHRTLSASARKKISLAQKARWAKAKGHAPKPRSTMSASARRKIAAAQRARWAKWKVKRGKKAA